MTFDMLRRSGLAALLLLAGCSSPQAEGGEPADEAVVIGAENVSVVRSEPIQTGPVISGALEAERAATVRAEIGGSLLESYAEQGEAVRAGDLLARLGDEAVRDAMLSAQSGVRSAEIALGVAQREAERAERLVAGGALAARELEVARSALSAAQAQAADASARLAAARERMEATRVRSPLSGVVSERAVSAGDVVTPGQALFTVIDPSSLRLAASVPSAELAGVRPGVAVDFTVQGQPGRVYQGRVERVSPAVDPRTGQVPILVSLRDPAGGLAAGLFAEGRVATVRRTAAVVPASAVQTAGSVASVARVRGGRAERVPVEVGIRDAATERVEIVRGLAPGDTVLTGAAAGITGGTPVRIGSVAPGGAEG